MRFSQQFSLPSNNPHTRACVCVWMCEKSEIWKWHYKKVIKKWIHSVFFIKFRDRSCADVGMKNFELIRCWIRLTSSHVVLPTVSTTINYTQNIRTRLTTRTAIDRRNRINEGEKKLKDELYLFFRLFHSSFRFRFIDRCERVFARFLICESIVIFFEKLARVKYVNGRWKKCT